MTTGRINQITIFLKNGVFKIVVNFRPPYAVDSDICKFANSKTFVID